MAHIYKITNIINDNQYVGKTERKPEDRWREHLYHAKTDGPMVISKAIRKHGEKNFKFEVIEECSTAEMNSKEIYWIDYYDTYHNGYNSSLGGDGAGLGVKRERGAVHPSAKAVDCYDLEGKYLCTYDSQGEAAWDIGRSNETQCINFCIKGITFQAFGHRWTWKDEPLKEVNNRINLRGKVYGVHLESGRKKMWKSQADAAEEIHGDRKNNNDISHAMKRNDKENTTKVKVKGWYLFRDKKIALSDWKPTEPNKFTHEQAVAAGKLTKGISKPTFWKPIKGVNIQTGEIVKFNHAADAVKNLRSETCKVTQPGINKCCKHTEKGELTYTCPHWNGLYKPYQNGGYTWYYDIDVNK